MSFLPHMSAQPPLPAQWHSTFQYVSQRGDPSAKFAPPKWSPEEGAEFRGRPRDRPKTDVPTVAVWKQRQVWENQKRKVTHFGYQGQTKRHQGIIVTVEDHEARIPQHGRAERVQVHRNRVPHPPRAAGAIVSVTGDNDGYFGRPAFDSKRLEYDRVTWNQELLVLLWLLQSLLYEKRACIRNWPCLEIFGGAVI